MTSRQLTKADIDLSPQQLKVLQFAWDGLSIKETAAQMGLADKTVKNYRANIYDKFHVHNVEGMLRRGVEFGYLTVTGSMEEWP